MKVAVLGATGFIGRALVPALAEQAEVLAISRHGDARESTHVRALAADATDEAAISRALEGVDVAYYLVHSLGTSDFGGVDRRAAAVVASAADRACRRRRLSRGRRRQSSSQRPDVRSRRARCSHVPRDDRAHRFDSRAPSPHRRGPCAQSAALLVLAPPRYACPRERRAPARRRAAQSDRRTRRAGQGSAPARADAVRRRRPRSARLYVAPTFSVSQLAPAKAKGAVSGAFRSSGGRI